MGSTTHWLNVLGAPTFRELYLAMQTEVKTKFVKECWGLDSVMDKCICRHKQQCHNKEKNRGKYHSQSKSTWFSKVSALSCHAYRGEDKVCRGDVGERTQSQ